MNNIPLSNQDITQKEIDAVVSTMKSDRLSMGPKTEAFESIVATRAGRKYGIAVNSGTSGLHLCVKSLGLKEGDEVITTPFSFVATTNCLLFEKVKPVFVDIDPVTYNLDPKLIEKAITSKTKGILPVEVFGNMSHFDEYEKIAKKHNLFMIEDCCEAMGGYVDGRPAGSFGDCGVFAFYPNKQITTGEGGMIVTDNIDIKNLCISLRNQGRDTGSWFGHSRLGYNYRMSEITAAIGYEQMCRLDEILAKRRKVALMYFEILADVNGISFPVMKNPLLDSWFVFVVKLGDEFTEVDRDAILVGLRDHGIGCNNYFAPIHTQPYISEMFGTRYGDYPITESVSSRTIALPFFSNLSYENIKYVKDVLSEMINKKKEE